MSKILLPRRQFIVRSAALGALLGGAGLTRGGFAQAPAIITSERMRPGIAQGVMSGDVLSDRAIIWSRTDRPARMWVEYATNEGFRDSRKVRGPMALDVTDYTARLDLTGLPAGQDIFYRVRFEDASTGRALSEPVAGRFRTAPVKRKDITFLWSGDTAGQGFGINTEWGGMKCYETMRRDNPDFFIHCGDTIYADGIIPAEIKLDDGTLWKNIITPEKSKVAETLNDFRGNHRYNLIDDNVRRFNAEVPQIWQWDDHEVTNNWSDSKDVSGDARYTEKNVPLMTARASRAFLEYAPMRWHAQDESERVYRAIPYGPLLDLMVVDMRSYRGANSHNTQSQAGEDTAFMGSTQIEWLKRQLKASKAVWKVIAADMPLGLNVPDGKDAQGRDKWEALANGDNGVPSGRELELAGLLSWIKKSRIRNVVWLTADVHYTAAHYYDPNKAKFGDFDGFWEFVSGPLNAGSFGPNGKDDTFGITVMYEKGPAKQNTPPTANLQFYGAVGIDAKTAAMTVALKDLNGVTLYTKVLEPKRG
jgi:alkaline phosphatase D